MPVTILFRRETNETINRAPWYQSLKSEKEIKTGEKTRKRKHRNFPEILSFLFYLLFLITVSTWDNVSNFDYQPLYVKNENN